METRKNFDQDKQLLLEKALIGLEQLHSNLNNLNRNLETINAIGLQFEAPAHLWSSFHKSIKVNVEPESTKSNAMQKEHSKTIFDNTTRYSSLTTEERL
ncbi:uncharacterized protein BX663DRAFT_517102 [Cokeromyces recurvatus]|uniref:uncharacterized protein n=1 Tax=Cokeromyces recurvatus TaxID=90255 RepID=UPI002220D3F2|nr:uncharacterized protein BX663DRAFT_517102 [Cokeromyces recurvatus]KAI7900643.1 hypothetical protein BX663DRAFT_517102 [Cokeromyces recurvatus]